jgi:ribosomal protein S11
MKTFVVNSAILSSNMDAKACAVGAPKMLKDAGVENVKVKSCYCCGEEGRVVFIMSGDSRDAVLEAFQKVNVPVASIMESTEVSTKM